MKISIIIPVYNVESYLDRCLKSVVEQSYKDLEIILVDDGSLDNCSNICDDWEKKDTRIKVIHKQNEGLGYARNTGIEVATGEYICFIDSDDYVSLDMCQILVDTAVEYSADIVYGSIFYDNLGEIKKESTNNEIKIWEGKKQIRDLILSFVGNKPTFKKDTIMEVSVWKALFRTEIFNKYNIRFVSERQFISEDLIFDIDYISKTNKVVLIPEPIYYYCINSNSLSNTYRSDRFNRVKILYSEVKIKLKKLFPEEDIEIYLSRFLIARGRTNARQIVHNENILGKNEVKKLLKNISCDKDLEDILKNYPIYKLPKKYYLIAALMKYKKIFLLRLLLKL